MARARSSHDLTPAAARLGLALIALVLLLASIEDTLAGFPAGADLPSHLAEVVFLAGRLRALDGALWFEGASLGYPLFAAYQPLPALLTALVVLPLQGLLPAATVMALVMVALWMAVPIAWAWGGRALGLDRLTALVLGALALAVHDYTGFGLSIRAVADWGLYTQQWAMIALPIAVGALHRHLRGDGEGRLAAVLAVAAVALTHGFFALLTAELALLMVVVERRGMVLRLGRLVGVGALAALLIAPWLVPLLRHYPELGGLAWRGATSQGVTPGQLVAQLASGALLDDGRWPWLGSCALVGAIGAAWAARRDARARLVLATGALGLVMWLGRTTWGPGLDRLPFHRELEVVRYLSALHAAALVLAALAIAAGVRASAVVLAAALGRVPGVASRALGIAAALVVGAIAVGRGQDLAEQVVADAETPAVRALVEALAARPGGGRLHGDAELGTSSARLRNWIALRSGRPLLGSHSRGYHDTLGTFYALSFDRSAVQARLYQVSALVALGPAPPLPAGAWRRSLEAGPYTLWSTTTTVSAFAFVRTPVVLGGPPRLLRAALAEHAPPLFARGMLPALDPALPPPADAAGVLRAARAATVTPTVSRVLASAEGPNRYAARVRAAGGDERLAVAVSWDRGWTAWVDEVEVRVARAGPSHMVVDVPAGEHVVELVYRGPAERAPLALLAGVVLVGLVVVDGSRGARREVGPR